MRTNVEAMNVIVGPACRRAERHGLERIITDLADDKKPPAPVRRRMIRPRTAAIRLETPLNAMAPRRFAVERIISGNDLAPINYLERGLVAARAVGRIEVRGSNRAVIAYGTGFLVAEGVLVTNAHVLTSAAEVGRSDVQFRYEQDINGSDVAPVTFGLTTDGGDPIIDADLDVAIVGVASRSDTGQDLRGFGWLRLDPTPGKGAIGEYLSIIQHPNGARKQICVRENKLLKYDANGPFVWYQTDTVGGSSGSPVFNNAWEVVALHHSGVPKTRTDRHGNLIYLTPDGSDWDPSMGDDAIDWYANEGIRVSRIVEYLAATCPQHPLAQRILGARRLPWGRAPTAPESATAPHLDDHGVLRLSIPLEVRIGSFGAPSIGPATSSRFTVADDAEGDTEGMMRPAGPRLIESVIVESDYDHRNGYDPHFLGGGLTAPLPVVDETTQKAYGKAVPTGDPLAYYNYSAVFSTKRRLAYFSACNIRSDLFKGERADGDKWYHDPRLAEDSPQAAEVDDSWYGRQALAFEADRSANPFDRGHLCARNHLQWGDTLDIAKRNGNDSFHFTNCTPQHWQFNQNSRVNGLWFATEDEVLLRTDTSRLCVINGPIFNAPKSVPGADGLWQLNPTGRRVKDPVFNGIAIPKQFFKVIVWRIDRQLRYLAFVVTQEGLLETIDWPDVTEAAKPQGLTDGEAALYRVPLATVAKLSGLDFGKLATAVTSPTLFEATDTLVAIEALSDLTREVARA